KGEADEMVRGRIHSEQLHIEHVAQPGDRMPIGLLAMNFSERPSQSLFGDALLNNRIEREVIRIVVPHEIIQANTPEGGDGKQSYAQGNEAVARHVPIVT